MGRERIQRALLHQQFFGSQRDLENKSRAPKNLFRDPCFPFVSRSLPLTHSVSTFGQRELQAERSARHSNRSTPRAASGKATARKKHQRAVEERARTCMPFLLSLSPSPLSPSQSAPARRPHFAPDTHPSSGPDAAWATTARRAATGAAAGRRAGRAAIRSSEESAVLIEAGRAAAAATAARGAAAPRRASTAGRAATGAREVASISAGGGAGGGGGGNGEGKENREGRG